MHIRSEITFCSEAMHTVDTTTHSEYHTSEAHITCIRNGTDLLAADTDDVVPAATGAQRILRGASARASCRAGGGGYIEKGPTRQPRLLPAQQHRHRRRVRGQPVQA